MDPRAVWYYINERERIRQKRDAGLPRPWTKDPILNDYKFCNVFRRHDRVSRWITCNWAEPNLDHPNLWFACALARLINWPDSLEEIGFPKDGWDPSRVQRILEGRIARGEKAFTSAYIIAPGYAGIGKSGWVVHNVLTPLWKEQNYVKPREADTLESAHTRLKRFRGLGDFTAFEVVLDWREYRYLCNAPDRFSFAAAGPGAIRGLNRIHERSLDRSISFQQALLEMRELLEIANGANSPIGSHVALPLELGDIEGVLCEVDKYLRIQRDGRSRERFIPSKVPLPLINY